MRAYCRWLRFWHCLLRLHRAVDMSVCGHTYLYCECGRLWPANDGLTPEPNQENQ